jgi:predicted DNA-binding WGR domain protein
MHNGPRPQFLRRVDPTHNMARFYVLSLQPTFFGETSLVRQWGRIGTRGREKIEYFMRDTEAASAMSKLSARKVKRGYAGDDCDIAAGSCTVIEPVKVARLAYCDIGRSALK